MIFLVSEDCHATSTPGFRETVEAMKNTIRSQVELAGGRLVTIGIATDWSVESGLRVLGHFGAFDEVVAGGSWLNLGTQRYIWGDLGGPGGVPQVVIVSRDVVVDAEIWIVENEQILARKLGTEEIFRWQSLGFPVALD